VCFDGSFVITAHLTSTILRRHRFTKLVIFYIFHG
jgi:hypothetical protein